MLSARAPLGALLVCSVAVGGASGCRKDNPRPTGATVASSAAAPVGSAGAALSAPGAPGGAGDAGVSPFAEPRAFVGVLGKDMPVRLALLERGGTLTAVVFPGGVPGARTLRGPSTGRGPFRLTEAGRGKGAKAVLEVELRPDDTLAGKWLDGKGKPLPLSTTPESPLRDTGDFARGYAGFLGDTMRLRMQLKRVGSRLEGYYRYARSTEDLSLDGEVDAATGRFTLRERDKGGTETGRFRGVLLTSFSAVGEWSSPDGARRFFFVLEGAPDLPRTLDLPGGVRMVPSEQYQPPTPSCAVTTEYTYPQLRGIADKAAEARVNDGLKALLLGKGENRNDLCEAATPERPFWEDGSYEVTDQRGKAVALRASGYAFTGGAHGNGWTECVVVDLQEGALLKPSARLDDAQRARLTARVNEELRKEHKTEKLSEAGFFDDEVKVSKETELCFDGGKLVVQFQAYEVAPYVMGAPTVTLAKDEGRALFGKDPTLGAFFP